MSLVIQNEDADALSRMNVEIEYPNVFSLSDRIRLPLSELGWIVRHLALFLWKPKFPGSYQFLEHHFSCWKSFTFIRGYIGD